MQLTPRRSPDGPDVVDPDYRAPSSLWVREGRVLRAFVVLGRSALAGPSGPPSWASLVMSRPNYRSCPRLGARWRVHLWGVGHKVPSLSWAANLGSMRARPAPLCCSSGGVLRLYARELARAHPSGARVVTLVAIRGTSTHNSVRASRMGRGHPVDHRRSRSCLPSRRADSGAIVAARRYLVSCGARVEL